MREIKFRAWDIKIAEMISDWQDSICIEYVGFNGGDKYILMQFTGLTDKNGKDIYEGDIVDDQFDCGQLMIVYYSDINAAFMVDHIRHQIMGSNDTFKCCIAISPEASTKGTVVGNIHENPELMEV